jgi:lysophospholipase L1-like esterase
VRIVLLGDSHLARVRRDLTRLGDDVLNAARGGATVRDLERQSVAALSPSDVAVVSVGTNDAAPWHGLSLAEFQAALDGFVASLPAGRVVVVAPPGVDESRLGPGDRTNAGITGYRESAAAVATDHGARWLDTPSLLAPLGAVAFADDGVHLSGTTYAVLLPAIAECCGND